MDIQDFLKNGATVPNPNYKKPSKKNPAGSPRFIKSDNYQDALDYGDYIGEHLGQYSYDLSHLNNDKEKWEDYNVHINPVDSEEELKKERANNQSTLEQTGRFLTQAIGNEAVIGTFLGFSNLVDAAINIRTKKGENDYTNPASTYLENLQNEIRDRYTIYEKDPNATWAIGDFGWWANNAVSMATAASLLLPGYGVAKGISFLGRIGNIGTKASRLAAIAAKKVSGTTRSTARLSKSIGVGAEIGTTAFINRTAENYMEARDVYNSVKEDALNQIKKMSKEEKEKMIKRNPQLENKSDEEMASYIAGASADETFRNDYAMLLMDIAQFKAIGSLWKGVPSKNATAALRNENKKAIKSLLGETVDNATKTSSKNSWLSDRMGRIKEALKHPFTTARTLELGEGIEEGYQGIQSEKGKEVAKMILNPEFTPRTIDSYLTDGEIWEQAVWGVAGGWAFNVAGKGLGNLYYKGKAYYKYKTGKLSEEDFKSKLIADEKIRSTEIQGRQAIIKKFTDDMRLLNDLKSPDEYRTDPITGERIKEDGVEINRPITPEEAEIKKAESVYNFVFNMALNAADKGNYDLFKEFVSSPEFDKYFKDAGVEITAKDKQFSQELLRRADEVVNNYETNLYNILKNTEVENESVARIAAREITREQLAITELSERKDLLQDKINKINSENIDTDYYKRKAITSYVKKQLSEIDRREQAMYEDYRNNNITEQAKKQYEKEYNLRRKSLVKFLNDNNPFNGDIAKQISELYKNIKKDDASLYSEINKTMDAIEDFIDSNTVTDTPNAIKELIDKQIGVEDALSFKKFILPITQNDYVERVNDISQQVDLLTITRLNDAAKKVEDYIIKQKDLQQALEDVMSGNVPELKKELDLLKIGHYSTDAYAKSILATIKEEQSNRRKKEQKEKEVVVDGSKSSEKKAETIKQNIDNINDNIEEKEEQKEKEKQSSPSTGVQLQEEQKGTAKPVDTIEEESAKATITIDDIEEFDKAAQTDAKKIAEAYELNIDDLAVGRASTIAFDIFKTSRNIFDDALGKDINSEEVQKLINMIIEGLEEQGVSVGVAPAAAKRGARLALNQISRRLSSKKDTKAELFKTLADSIAAKQDMTVGLSAATKSLNDAELDAIIDRLLETYKEYKEISTPKGQKTIINLERLFNDIIYNKEIDIDIDTAFYILYNMKDYISNPLNTKYIFTHKRSLNSILKNPAEFFNSVVNARLKEVQLDNYMHISPSSIRTDEYKKLIAGLLGNEEVEITTNPDRNGNINSISFKVNGKEIGYVSTVSPNSTNTGYSVFISRYSGGIAYSITKNGENYSSNTDKLFESIFNENDVLWEIINKQHRHNLNAANRAISDEEIEKFMDHPIIKGAIQKEIIILPKKWDERTKQVVDKYVTNKQKAQFIINALEGVVFFDTYAQSRLEFKSSYRQWIKEAFSNYENTHKIQVALEKNKKIITKFSGLSSTYGRESTDVKAVIDEEEHGISEIGLTFDRNPIVGVVNSDGNTTLINEKTGVAISNGTPFNVGSMGMLIGGNENNPILALFTSANKLGDKIKKQLKDELTDILTGFQEKRYTYEEVDKKLSSLFNGPGINNPTIFQGYSVIHSERSLALSIGGQTKQYALIINKYKKKESTDLGTRVNYLPNGDINKAKTSISVDKKIIESIVNEIINNVVYNKTFFTLKNTEKDNTADNPYMYKENGKFVIEIGGVKTVYDSFGDFVLQENAFNTNQGRNEQGGYFDNTDKVNSLYIDVSVLEAPDSKQSPVKGEQYQSIADTIKTASTDKFNLSKEILEKAELPKEEVDFLTGNNIYNIPLVPEEYGYDKKLTKEYAEFRKGRIFFGNAGASYANSSPFNLKRLLIHEHLHDRINKLNLFEKENLVEDLFDTYNATLEAIEDIIQNANEDSAEFKNAVAVRNWLEENKFNPVDYFTQFNKEKNEVYANMSEEQRARIFAEEWLVETITQPLIMNFLNNTNYRGKEVIVEGIAEENKTIWQKIIDLLLKLFGKGRNNIKNNTIFAQQYFILGNITNNNNTATETQTNQQIDDTENKKDIIEEETNDEETNTEYFDEELGILNEDEGIDEDTQGYDEEIILDDEIRLASTISAEEFTTEEETILKNALRDGQGNLLAPNGKISNLTEKQYAQVRTKAFKEWFGDWENDPENASKVIDGNGEPLVVYHGTKNKWNILDPSKFGTNTDEGYYGRGLYLSSVENKAKQYGEVMPLFVNMKNPIRVGTDPNITIDEATNNINIAENFNRENYSLPYDGVLYSGSEGIYEEIVIANPNQIKSAINNTGDFNTNDPDIRKAVTSSAEEYVTDYMINDGGATAETFGVTQINNMEDYLNMFAEQDKPLIAKMLQNNEIRYACR